jgi:hypothetical protein
MSKEEKIQFIRENAGKIRAREMAKELKVKVHQVRHLARENDIKISMARLVKGEISAYLSANKSTRLSDRDIAHKLAVSTTSVHKLRRAKVKEPEYEIDKLLRSWEI